MLPQLTYSGVTPHLPKYSSAAARRRLPSRTATFRFKHKSRPSYTEFGTWSMVMDVT